jgi:hypothetical protein
MNPDDSRGGPKSQKSRPLLVRMPLPLGVVVLLVLSYGLAVFWMWLNPRLPYATIVGAPLTVLAYYKVCYGGKRPSMGWIGIGVLVGNGVAFVLACLYAIGVCH